MPSGTKALKEIEAWTKDNKMIPEQLNPLAMLIRDEYVRLRKATHKYYHLDDTRYNMLHWKRVAIRVLDLKADPKVYVNAAFRVYHERTSPESLLSTQMLDNYSVHTSEFINNNLKESVQTDLILFIKKLQQREHEGFKTRAELLQDTDICPCDLFIWCIAVRSGLLELAQRYKAGADKLLMQPAYKEVYTQMFPEVFKCQ